MDVNAFQQTLLCFHPFRQSSKVWQGLASQVSLRPDMAFDVARMENSNNQPTCSGVLFVCIGGRDLVAYFYVVGRG